MSLRTLLTPQNCTVVFIDHQPQMAFGIASIDRQELLNNTVGLAKAAKAFDVPTILTAIESATFSGYMWPQLLAVFPDIEPIERTNMNAWEEPGVVSEVKRLGRKKLVIRTDPDSQAAPVGRLTRAAQTSSPA